MQGEYKAVKELKGHDRPIASVRWNRRGDRLLSTSADGLALIWEREEENEASSMKKVQTLAGAHREGLNEAAWSRDGVWCATASDDKTARLWDVERGAAVVNLEGHESYVFCVDIHPLSGLVVTGSFDETFKIWDTRTGNCIKSVEAHSDPVTGVRFDTPSASSLVTCSFDGLVRLWDVRTGSCIATMFTDSSDLPKNNQFSTEYSKNQSQQTKQSGIPVPQKKFSLYAPVSHLEISPNGIFLLTSHHDSALRMWDIASVPCRRVRTYHEKFVNTRYCLASTFHAKCHTRRDHIEHHLIATGSEDGHLLMWNLQSAKLEHDIPNAHDGDAVLAIDSHPVYDLLATAGGRTKNNFIIKLWAWSSSLKKKRDRDDAQQMNDHILPPISPQEEITTLPQPHQSSSEQEMIMMDVST